MIFPEAPPARGAPRSAHAQSSCKCAAIVAAVIPLAVAFVLAGAPTATVFTSNHVTSVSGLHSAPCTGKNPGVCPGPRDKQNDDSGQVSDRNGSTDSTGGRVSIS
jgi:hypothetical protein